MNTITIIGAGNLGGAIYKGLLKTEYGASTKINCTTRASAHQNDAFMQDADIILLCVKPYQINDVLKDKPGFFRKEQIIVSTAAVFGMTGLRSLVGDGPCIARAMPNTASSVSQSITCISTDDPGRTEFEKVERLFKTMGKTLVIPEHLMNAATVAGASGIAFAMRFARALIQSGIQMGFTASQSTLISEQMIKGAMELLLETGIHPELAIDQVTTPKGCTIAGLTEMEYRGFSAAVNKGIQKSYSFFTPATS